MITVLITLTTAGVDTGPFNLFSNVDGYTSAFDSNVPKNLLELGYPSDVVPDDTTIIRVQSVNSLCNNYVNLPTGITTTSTTTTACPNCSAHDVTIGTQIWAGCNLNVTTYANGDPIQEVTDPTAWGYLTEGAWCSYNNDSANDAIYGKLYNWYAVNDVRGLVTGYHTPSNNDFNILRNFLGGQTIAGGVLKQTGLCHWNVPNTGATNTSGFSALGAGYRSGSTGSLNFFGNLGIATNWWSSVSTIDEQAYIYSLAYNAITFNSSTYPQQGGFSVRLIKD